MNSISLFSFILLGVAQFLSSTVSANPKPISDQDPFKDIKVISMGIINPAVDIAVEKIIQVLDKESSSKTYNAGKIPPSTITDLKDMAIRLLGPTVKAAVEKIIEVIERKTVKNPEQPDSDKSKVNLSDEKVIKAEDFAMEMIKPAAEIAFKKLLEGLNQVINQNNATVNQEPEKVAKPSTDVNTFVMKSVVEIALKQMMKALEKELSKLPANSRK